MASGIMTISQRSTISALMKTCHTLYTEGPKHILRDGVDLTSKDQITRFTTFMLTKDPSRFAYMRKLVIYTTCDTALEDLTRLLAHPAIVLDTLELRSTSNVLVGATTDAMRDAIRRLTTIKHLVVFGIHEYSGFPIKSLPYQLESISIGMKSSLRDALSTLTPFSHTLRTLIISSEQYVAGLGSFHFPHVHTFGILYSKYILDDLTSPTFAQTFPGITHLQLIPADPQKTRRQTSPRTNFSWQFGFSGSLQRSQGRRSDGTAPSLSSLVECSGGLLSVYALHLDCTLSTLRLWQDVQAGELGTLRTVLRDTRPARLCLSVELADAEALFAALRDLAPPARVDLRIFVSETVVVCQTFRCSAGFVNVGPHVIIFRRSSVPSWRQRFANRSRWGWSNLTSSSTSHRSPMNLPKSG